MANDMLIIQRRTLIDIARRRSRPGSGSSMEFLKKRTATMHWPNLETVLAPIRFAVIGAVATRLYMPERATQDLSIIIAVVDAKAAHQKLLAAGHQLRSKLAVGGSSWQALDGPPVDLLEGREPWWVAAIAAAQENRDAQGLPVLPLHYLVLLKWQAGRVQDLADITRMLGQAEEKNLQPVRELFDLQAPNDREDLESMIALGRLEYHQ